MNGLKVLTYAALVSEDTPSEKRTPSSGDCGYVRLELVG